MTNAHIETGQRAVCCQNLLLGVLSSCSTPSVLVGVLFQKFGLFLNTPRIPKIDVVFLVYLFIYLFAQGSLNDTVGSLDYRGPIV